MKDLNFAALAASSAANFPESRERRLKLLEERKCRYEESKHCEFTAEEALIGLIIGKQGEKLTRVAREHKVEIRVLPDDTGIRRVKIYGSDMSSVQRARSVLEYVYIEYRLPEEMIGWILGKKGGNIKDVSQKAGLHSAWFDDANRVILLCGLRQAVDQAVQLLNCHAHSYRVSQHSSTTSANSSGFMSPPPPPHHTLVITAEQLEAEAGCRQSPPLAPAQQGIYNECTDTTYRYL